MLGWGRATWADMVVCDLLVIGGLELGMGDVR